MAFYFRKIHSKCVKWLQNKQYFISFQYYFYTLDPFNPASCSLSFNPQTNTLLSLSLNGFRDRCTDLLNSGLCSLRSNSSWQSFATNFINVAGIPHTGGFLVHSILRRLPLQATKHAAHRSISISINLYS